MANLERTELSTTSRQFNTRYTRGNAVGDFGDRCKHGANSPKGITGDSHKMGRDQNKFTKQRTFKRSATHGSLNTMASTIRSQHINPAIQHQINPSAVNSPEGNTNGFTGDNEDPLNPNSPNSAAAITNLPCTALDGLWEQYVIMS